jgi:hypothetical protein
MKHVKDRNMLKEEYQPSVTQYDIFQRYFDNHIKGKTPVSLYGHTWSSKFKGHGMTFDNGYKYITQYSQSNGLVTSIIGPDDKIIASI